MCTLKDDKKLNFLQAQGSEGKVISKCIGSGCVLFKSMTRSLSNLIVIYAENSEIIKKKTTIMLRIETDKTLETNKN